LNLNSKFFWPLGLAPLRSARLNLFKCLTFKGPGVYTGYKMISMNPSKYWNNIFIWSMILNPYSARPIKKKRKWT
jgi:hypothetical protein